MAFLVPLRERPRRLCRDVLHSPLPRAGVWATPINGARLLLFTVIASHAGSLLSAVGEHDWGEVIAFSALMLLAVILMSGARFINLAIVICAGEGALSLLIGDGYAAILSMVLVAFAVGCRRRRAPIIMTSLVFAAWSVAFVVMRPPVLGDFISPFVPTFAVALGLGALIGQGLHSAALNAALDAERAEERLELARELHHSVARTLSMAKMHASLLAEQQGIAEAGWIEALCGESLEDLRRLMSTLATHVDDAGGLASDVTPPPVDARSVVAECAQRLREVGHDVALTLPPAEVVGSPAAAVARVVQEATSNITQHAPATTSCVVALSIEARGVRLVVTNAGTIRPRRRSTGLGLPAVRERVEALGGTFVVGPAEGGWTLDAYIPTATDRVILPAEMLVTGTLPPSGEEDQARLPPRGDA